MKFLKTLILLLIVAQSLWACKKDPAPSPVIPPVFEKTDYKVLFVGNSYTYYNDGVDFHLQKMLRADSSSDSINYVMDKIAVGAYTLEAHFNDPVTITKLKSQKWNTVVLQEQSTRPINNPALFLEYAGKLDVEIKKINAKTMLYMTWPNKDAPKDMDSLEAVYLSVGKQLNAQVAPAGKVWEYIQKTNPQIELYISDNKHPTLSGTYAVACVFYFSMFNKNPVENTYIPSGMSMANVVAIRKAVYDYMILIQ
jgi:hypothetical protein